MFIVKLIVSDDPDCFCDELMVLEDSTEENNVFLVRDCRRFVGQVVQRVVELIECGRDQCGAVVFAG